MSNYTKATNFAVKDALPSGNAGKIVKGTEIDTEFNAIASAVSSKADTNSPTLTGTPLAPTASAGTNTTQIATTAFVTAADVAERTATATLTNKTLTSPTINGGTITGITDLAVADGGTGASTFTANSVLLGNGTSAFQTVAPSTNGNVLTSNGTTWQSVAPTTPAALSTASGSAPSYSARAWVNFNGTGTISIRASANVSSITDNGTGDYTVNFTTAMSDSNYSAVGSAGNTTTSYGTGTEVAIHKPTTFATGSYRFQQGSSGNSAGAGTPIDTDNVTVAIFR